MCNYAYYMIYLWILILNVNWCLGRGLRWFPRGRRPLAIVPGLHYDLDLEDLEDIVGEEIEVNHITKWPNGSSIK